MNYNDELNDLKKLNEVINEARTSFNDILEGICDNIAEKFDSEYFAFDDVDVDQYDGFSNTINGYSSDLGFFDTDPNNYVDMDNLTTDSLVNAMDTIIKTARRFHNEED